MNRYKRDNKGFRAMVNGPEARKFAAVLAEHWANRLREIAPYDDRDEIHYKDNIVTAVDGTTLERLAAEYPRVAAFIGVDVPYATALEYGNSRMHNPPRSLARLVDEIQAQDPNLGRRKHGGI